MLNYSLNLGLSVAKSTGVAPSNLQTKSVNYLVQTEKRPLTQGKEFTTSYYLETREDLDITLTELESVRVLVLKSTIPCTITIGTTAYVCKTLVMELDDVAPPSINLLNQYFETDNVEGVLNPPVSVELIAIGV